MSSKYLPRTTKRNTPPWCKAGLFPPIPPITAGVPDYLVAYLVWKDPDLVPPADLTASIKLGWNADENKWMANQAGPGHSLGAYVQQQNGSDQYTLSVELWTDGVLAESHEFENVNMGPDFPWDSRLQELITLSGIDEQIMQVWA
ncbi:unnamed protein product [marine sediment metagenome]|uniref:Uncharacterized protein n=1 Tax=marine sediment metagenome TaxID=412755 RepID=X0UZQ9_9ZZZZ